MANHNVVFAEENGTSPAPLVKRRLERSAERDKREIKNNFSAVPAQSNAERSSNRPAGAKLQSFILAQFPYTATPARPKDRPVHR